MFASSGSSLVQFGMLVAAHVVSCPGDLKTIKLSYKRAQQADRPVYVISPFVLADSSRYLAIIPKLQESRAIARVYG